jgi:hypothetical protein
MLILFIIPLATATHFTEIMYAPLDGNEYVEVYSSSNLAGCLFGDIAKNYSLNLTAWTENWHQLILPKGSPYQELENTTIYTVMKLGNGLNNDGDTIWLACNETIIDNITYYGSIANRNNRSMELKNGTWYESALGGTPGRPPQDEQAFDNDTNTSIEDNQTRNDTTQFSIIITLPRTILAFYEYTSIMKITNSGEPKTITWWYELTQNETAILRGNRTREINKYTSANTGSIRITNAGNYTICAWTETTNKTCAEIEAIDTTKEPCNISITLTSPMIVKEGDSLKYEIRLTNESIPFQATYSIEDEHGEVIRAPYTTDDAGQKKYTPHGTRPRLLHINASLDFIACNTSGNKTADAYAIFVPVDTGPNIMIEQVSLGTDKTVRPGEKIRVRLSANRADNKQSTMKVWVEQRDKTISEIITLGLEKYDSATFTIDLRIREGEGKATVIAKGFGASDEEEITISPSEEANQEEAEEEKEITLPPEILSFYVRAKNYQDTINAFARIQNAENAELYEVRLLGNYSTNGTITMPANISKANTTLLLIARGNGTATKTIKLNLETSQITKKNASKSMLETIRPPLDINNTIAMKTAYKNSPRAIIAYIPFVILGIALLAFFVKPKL